MGRVWAFILAAATALVLAGCPADDRAVDDRALEEPVAEGPVCLQGKPFVADGEVPVAEAAAPADAERLGALRWEAHDGCERLVIDLLTEGRDAAQGPGDVTAEVLREVGVVRVSLRNVEWVEPDATNARFDGPLARAAYAVFSPEGRWVFLDIHLAEPAEAHVATLSQPARVVVDLRPGGPTVPDLPISENRVVVLEPRPGTASYPLTVRGYARTFEANVVVRLEHQGEETYEDFTTATAWADAWGHFELTIEDGPRGDVTLHVGEHSARDGVWEGAEVALELR
jgi:hypothetical protein